jgi:hypothetical protein
VAVITNAETREVNLRVSTRTNKRTVWTQGNLTLERLRGSAADRGHCTSLAKATASIEPASGAERAAAARLEALEPRAYDKATRKHEMAPQEVPTDVSP